MYFGNIIKQFLNDFESSSNSIRILFELHYNYVSYMLSELMRYDKNSSLISLTFSSVLQNLAGVKETIRRCISPKSM